MLRVSKDEFANELSLAWTFLNDCTIVSEEMIDKEFVKFLFWALCIFIDLLCQILAEEQCISETAL